MSDNAPERWVSGRRPSQESSQEKGIGLWGKQRSCGGARGCTQEGEGGAQGGEGGVTIIEGGKEEESTGSSDGIVGPEGTKEFEMEVDIFGMFVGKFRGVGIVSWDNSGRVGN